jgi:FG-GAP-like repeat
MRNTTNILRKLAMCASLIVAGTATSAAHAQFTFSVATGVAAGMEPGGLAAGDFNGDGLVDLATTTDAPDSITILFNNGAGGVVLGLTVPLPNSSSPGELVAGDVDGDGDDDFVVILKDQLSVMTVYQATPGSFTLGGTAPVGDRPRGIDMADIDGNGSLDVAVANRDDNTISVLLNDGTGVFSSMTIAVGAEPRAVAIADFDGDEDGDIAVTEHDARTVRILSNSANVFSSTAVLSVPANVRPDGIEAADLNGDDIADLAVATSDQTLGLNQVTVYLNSGGSFTGPMAYALGGTNASSVVAADFDCDGDMDLAAANQDSNNVSLVANAGNGTFGAAMQIAVGVTPEIVSAADIDGDGSPDVSTANRDSNSVAVALNQSCPDQGIPGDLDGDGDVDQADLGILLSCYNTSDCGDIDGDGDTDQADLGTLLANYGT